MRPKIPSGSAFFYGNSIYFCSSARGIVGATCAPPYVELEREAPAKELGETIELVISKASTKRLTTDTLAPLAKMAKMGSSEFLSKTIAVSVDLVKNHLHYIPSKNLGNKGVSELPDKAIILPASASLEKKGEALLRAFGECVGGEHRRLDQGEISGECKQVCNHLRSFSGCLP